MDPPFNVLKWVSVLYIGGDFRIDTGFEADGTPPSGSKLLGSIDETWFY